jgi:hypothetical protein
MKTTYFKAFTLIETTLYLALFNVIFLSVIGFTISITDSNRKAEYSNSIEKNAIFVSEHIQNTFSQSNSIDAVNTVYLQVNGKIRLITKNGYKEYSLSNGVLQVGNGSTTLPISDSKVNVTSFYIEPVSSVTGVQTGAKITIKFTASKYQTVTKSITSYYDFR